MEVSERAVYFIRPDMLDMKEWWKFGAEGVCTIQLHICNQRFNAIHFHCLNNSCEVSLSNQTCSTQRAEINKNPVYVSVKRQIRTFSFVDTSEYFLYIIARLTLRMLPLRKILQFFLSFSNCCSYCCCCSCWRCCSSITISLKCKQQRQTYRRTRYDMRDLMP